MLWFNKEKKKKMAFLQNFVPTSKANLMQVAMYLNKGDVSKAQEFVDFYAKNLDLPDFDPVEPSFMQQLKSGASDIFSWIKENQGDIVQGYQFIQGIIKNKGMLPDITPQIPDTPLPPINEM